MKKIITLSVLILILGFGCSTKEISNTAPKETYNTSFPEKSSSISEPNKLIGDDTLLSDEDIKNQISDTLQVLMTIHYVSVRDITTTNPESMLVDELTESMNDLNKLQGLLYKTEELSRSENEIIAVTGLALSVSTQSLIKIYNAWIQYLRGVNINNIDVSEFQYQIALFQSSTHDVYLKLIEGASLLPMITVKFEEDGEKNFVNGDLKNHLITTIDHLFKDILIDDDLFYKKTKNRLAIPILIRGYSDFFTSSE